MPLPGRLRGVRATGRSLRVSSTSPRAFVVVGPSCAGKTAFGELARRVAPEVPVFEASSVVRSFASEADRGLSALAFAQRLLRERGADVVARTLIERHELGPSTSFVITGFRTVAELDALRGRCPQTRVVLVQASVRTRFERHRSRGRPPLMSYEQFVEHDRAQRELGLLEVAGRLADIRIVNEGSRAQLRARVGEVLRPGAG